ncbi:sulfatase-like hydrolase/transferase [Novipirellula sp. SH528]|uniref:sulfatase-like hydrolase/transferase n=1 Tax=Novipirellula sp. SH528 TaxID=3454466 RepID=UPI003F9EFBE5
MPRTALLLGVFLLVACPNAGSAAERPNVLLICVDDLKPTIGCFGDPVAVTPNIDALAKRGVRFDSAYCNQAVCSPSRNSLMTGLRPQTIGVYDLPTHFRLATSELTANDPKRGEVVTFSQHFKNNGYLAQGLGKIYHVGHGNIDDKESWSVPLWRPKGPSYVLDANVRNIVPDAKGKKRGPATESADVDDETYGDGKIALETINRIAEAKQNPDQPFFIAAGFLKPHLPFVAPTKNWDLYQPSELPMPEVTSAPTDAPSYAATSGGELRNYSDMRIKGPIDSSTTRHLIHGYYAATSYVDAQIGKVIAALDEHGFADNTIIVLWGDHGWHLGDHGMWCKHTNYEQAARIPVIIAAPGAARDASTSAMLETVDIYPTLVELAGIQPASNLDGISQAAAVRDPEQHVRDYVTHVYPRSSRLGRAIRNSRYRMVQWKEIGAKPDSAEMELYDYETDPLETRNIASQYPEIVATMNAELDKQPEPKPQWKSAKQRAAAAEKLKQDQKKRAQNAKSRAGMFAKRDLDQDGFLTLEEFLRSQPDPDEAPKRFPKFDKNNDQKLSEDEFVHP